MTTPIVKAVHTRQLLDRILETPQLVTVIQSLNSQVLGKLIQHIGLEDSSAIISLTTTEQLKQVFDEDLWQNTKAGCEEKFDANRFGIWLDVMMELGTSFAAQKFMELDEDFLTYALSRHILVIDIEQMAMEMSAKERHTQEDDLLEKALESSLCQEFEEFRVFSKSHESWDSLIAILSTLDSEDHNFLHQLLERCCALSAEYIEDNGGLYDVLTSSEMLESDVSFEREQRREREGYVPPLTAKSFLSLIQETELSVLIQKSQTDYITKSHFKAYAPSAAKTQFKETATDYQTAKFIKFLQDEEVLEQVVPSSLLLEHQTASSDDQNKTDFIKAALSELKDKDPQLYQQRMTELNYLANILISGCNYDDRKFRPLEAADAVLATCNLGLETVHRTEPSKEAELKDLVIPLFQIGYKILHTKVADPARLKVKNRLSQAAQDPKLDEWTQKQLTNALKKDPAEQLEALELIMEPAAVHSIKMLTDELPSLANSPKKVLFISSWAQIREAQDLANQF